MSAPSAGRRRLSVIAVVIAALSVIYGSVYSETLSPNWTSALSAQQYFKHVSFLASDDLKGRGNGTPELQRASEYIASQFRTLGLKPAGDKGTFFENFQITTGKAHNRRRLRAFEHFAAISS